VSDKGEPRSAAVVAGEVLARPTWEERAHGLASLTGDFTPDLARMFLRAARDGIRDDPGDAAGHARLARTVATTLEDTPLRIESLRTLGQALVLRGAFGPALEALDTAADLARGADDERQAAELEMIRLHPLVHLERYAEVRLGARRALAFFTREDDRSGRIRVHMALADLAFRRDRAREALREYARVDRLLTDETPDRFRAVLAANRANALQARNRFRAAARQFALARRLFEEAGAAHSLAQVEYNAASADMARGSYESALRGYTRTEESFARLQDERHLGLIELERAEIHVRLNLPEEAEALAARAERRLGSLGMEKECAQAAQLAGRAAELDGRADDAEAALARAEDRFAALGLAERRVACLVQRAGLALRGERLDDARRLAGEAAALLEGDLNPLSAASVELLRARLDLRDGRATEALHRADAVRMLCRRIHAPWLQIEIHRLTGQIFRARGQVDEAIVAYRHAIDALEHYRGGVPPDEYMTAFLAGRSELYTETVQLLLRAGYHETAFEFTERAKSRALVDLLAGRWQDPEAAAGPASLTEGRIRHLREQLNAIYQRLFRHENGAEKRSARAVRRARQQAWTLERRMAKLLREARLGLGESASLDTVAAPDLDSVRRDLEPDAALVEYLVTGDEIVTFVVTQTELHVVRREFAAAELRRLLERFRFHLAKFDRQNVVAEDLILQATRANLGKLARVLIEPIARHLTVSRLVVVPHGLLYGLPFHALPLGDGWLADRYDVVYAPSAAVYGLCRGKAVRTTGPACIFGLPDEAAPLIEREVRDVAHVLATDRLHVGETATLAQLREDVREARLLHIATHGMFRREQPMLSSIRLADTWLNLYDIYGLELDCELVVLSTCESGIADVSEGDEILGLTRGFLYAGARALLASQWRVNDATTAEFMQLFYRHHQDGADAAAALRRTMAEIRAQRPHPYYWAPFFLTGRPLDPAVRRAPPSTVVRKTKGVVQKV
jgi:CHAT domain-containing protein/tetratricopeptide (TPR) repeat protein